MFISEFAMIMTIWMEIAKVRCSLHCRLCLNISDLNRNLVDRHLDQDALCTCGATSETVEDYLFYCPNHNIRDTTLHILPPEQVNIDILLNGTTSVPVAVNKN